MVSSIGLSKRSLSIHTTTSSLRDQSPNWNNHLLLDDGCDFEHWLVIVEKPADELTRDEIIDSYIKKLAQVFDGNMEEARQKIYSVSTRHYFAFGCLVSEEICLKIKELPGVRWVLPDSYLDDKNKAYGGEPFINGQAVPYDPKYHERWEGVTRIDLVPLIGLGGEKICKTLELMWEAVIIVVCQRKCLPGKRPSRKGLATIRSINRIKSR